MPQGRPTALPQQAGLRRRTAILKTALDTLAQGPDYRKEWTRAEAERLAVETETVMNPKDGHLDSESKSVKALTGRAPISRAVTRLLLAIGPAKLAEAWTGNVTLATNPTRMQSPLPIEATGILDRFLQEQILFVEATKEFREKQGPQDSFFSTTFVSRGEFRTGDPKLGVGKGILQLSGDERTRSLQAVLTVIDPKGRELATGYVPIDIPSLQPAQIEPKGAEEPIVPATIVKEMAAASREAPNSRGTSEVATSTGSGVVRLRIPPVLPRRKVPLSDELRQAILDPESKEPLALTGGSAILAAADRRGENLVACLQDDLFLPSLERLAAGVQPTQFLSSVQLQTDHAVSVSGGWITVRPKEPAEARRRYVNREALAKLLRSVDRNKLLILGDLCQFALSQETPAGFGKIDLIYLRLLNPAANGSYEGSKWHLYRLYGSLTPEQRRSLQNGGSIPTGTLSPAAREAMEKFVMGSYQGLKLTRPDGTEIEPYSEGIVTNWTQLLPNGLPTGAVLSATTEKADAAYCLDSASGAAEIVSDEALAAARFISETPGLQGGSQYDRFAPATLWTLRLNITLGPGIALESNLKDGVFDDTAGLRPFSELSTTFKSAVESRLAVLREAFGKMDFTHRGGTSAPPPN